MRLQRAVQHVPEEERFLARRRRLHRGAYIYEDHNIFDIFDPHSLPRPLHDPSNLSPFVCFVGSLLPHPMRTSYKYAPIGLALTTAHEADPDALLGINDARFESDVGYGSSGAYLGERGIRERSHTMSTQGWVPKIGDRPREDV